MYRIDDNIDIIDDIIIVNIDDSYIVLWYILDHDISIYSYASYVTRQ